MEKREMNIPRQWEKRVLGKGSPHRTRTKSVYPQRPGESQLAKFIAKLKKEWEKERLAKEIATTDSGLLGSEEEGDLSDKLSSYSSQAGDYIKGFFSDEDLPYMSSEGLKGESRYLNKLAREERGYGSMEDYDDDLGSLAPTWKEDTEGGSALDLMAEENWDPRIRGRTKGVYSSDDPQDKIDIETEPGTWDSLKGLFASDSDSDSGTKSKGLSPMQKYGAKLITDIFGEKEEAPQQSIGASPLTPGRSFDMSYLKSRPKKERYRNRGLLGGA